MANRERNRIEVRGTVQGVGFRPAALRHARSLKLSGFAANTKSGALIEIQGDGEQVRKFRSLLTSSMPENCVIDKLTVSEIPPLEEEPEFQILPGLSLDREFYSIPPDIATCPKCLEEFNDRHNRRYRFPFITCGDCGPRYSFVKKLPYDRENTSMSSFPMCEECLAQYNDPNDRRFHIEGFSCPKCGPKLTGLDRGIENLKAGKVVAVKGLGGYHLTCSALNPRAIDRLRQTKNRPTKPFAVMFRDCDEIKKFCVITDYEIQLLQSKMAPIVLVQKGKGLPENIAPNNGYLGVMVAYTPLHRIIIEECGSPIVVTSANVPGDPLIIHDRVMEENSRLCDSIVSHDRKIVHRADDSVFSLHGREPLAIRLGRGSTPGVFKVENKSGKDIVALGGELKNSICAVKGNNLIQGCHIGDMGNAETHVFFQTALEEMIENYSLKPEVVICDMHPDYETGRFALEYTRREGCELIRVQHHYAHFLSCYGENLLTGKALGLIFDGTGYGEDGNIHGGEFLLGDCQSYERLGHLLEFPLPGGVAALREPWKILSSFVEPENFMELFEKSLREFSHDAPIPLEKLPSLSMVKQVKAISQNREFSPLTSSMGRLFDAAAVIAGFRGTVTQEAEAAIFLESLALKSETKERVEFPFFIEEKRVKLASSTLIQGLMELRRGGCSGENLARIFHNSVIHGACKLAVEICLERGVENVILSGGVFMNRILLRGIEEGLLEAGLRVFLNRKVPSCDGGISFGQAIYGAHNA